MLVQIPAVRQAFGIAITSAADVALVSAIGVFVMVVIEASKIAIRRYTVSHSTR